MRARRILRWAVPICLALGVTAGTGLLGWSIVENHQNRRDINRIISPSPEEYQRGINQAIARLTPAQAAAIFRKLPRSVREELRGPRGARGAQGPRGARGASGSRGASGRTGTPGRTGGRGVQGLTAPQVAPPRSTPRPPPAPVRPPRAPSLIPDLPAPPLFPGEAPGTLPNGKPCPPRNPRCR